MMIGQSLTTIAMAQPDKFIAHNWILQDCNINAEKIPGKCEVLMYR
jgi:hypothetical protein